MAQHPAVGLGAGLGLVSLDRHPWPLVERPGPPKMLWTLSLSLLS